MLAYARRLLYKQFLPTLPIIRGIMQALRVIALPLVGALAQWIEPFPYLSGGNFSGPLLKYHCDPLGQYQWGAGVNQSQLQVFYLPPSGISLYGDTPAASFLNYEALLQPNTSSVTVAGAGGLVFDMGCETASWIEFDSPDLNSTSPQSAFVTVGVSEYNEYEITNLGPKVGKPIPYARAGGYTTWRLEPNPGLYEGVRFAWLWVNATPSSPWTITAVRAVAQIKPTNWGGAFEAVGDDMLSRIWYNGAYTVKVNLLSDQFGSILIYRGDRFSWTGDAHVAQATAIASLGNYDFVFQNLNFTKNNCNGIESYCLYFVLSVVDYWAATADAAGIAYLTAYVEPKLEHAQSIWGKTTAPLGFYGWDDRLGSGFSDANCAENVAAYSFLAMRSWRTWSAVMNATGQTEKAQHWAGYYSTAVDTVRAASPTWYAPLGLFASADAINAGFTTPDEQAAMVSAHFNSSITACGLSNFNTFFELEALSSAGYLDRAYATVHHCWDVQVVLGASCTWETSQPDWSSFLHPHAGIPGFEDGYTSMAHPWGSGATAWASKYLLGVQPHVDAGAAGYAHFTVAPHLAGNMSTVSGTVPTPHGPTHVHVEQGGEDACIAVHVPEGSSATLVVSDLLLSRLRVAARDGMVRTRVSSSHGAASLQGARELCAAGPLSDAHVVQLSFNVEGPVHEETGKRGSAATLYLTCGAHVLHMRVPSDRTWSGAAVPNPYPAPSYPATFVQRDEITQGSWLGTYGSAGYVLFAYDGVNQPVSALPPYISKVVQTFGHAANGPWATDGQDVRALQDPRNPGGLRKIGQYSVPVPPASGWDPSFPVDIVLTEEAEGQVTYQVAVYCVDFDGRGRRQTVSAMDGATFNTISPVVLLDDFTAGVWLVWQYSRSMRLRFNYIRGDNQVVSAVLFDTVNSTVSGKGE